MSTVQNQAFGSPLLGGIPTIEMFGKILRYTWMGLVATTVIAEVVPAVELLPTVFYSYKATKAFLFFFLGYVTPLAFHRFDRLNWGLVVALGSAAFVEGLQALIGNGHRLSVYDLATKMLLIGFGFIVALDARYEQAILIGNKRIRLTSDLIPDRDHTRRVIRN